MHEVRKSTDHALDRGVAGVDRKQDTAGTSRKYKTSLQTRQLQRLVAKAPAIASVPRKEWIDVGCIRREDSKLKGAGAVHARTADDVRPQTINLGVEPCATGSLADSTTEERDEIVEAHSRATSAAAHVFLDALNRNRSRDRSA